MIIFIFGENEYFINQKRNEIIGEYQKKHKSGLNFLKFNTANLDFDELKKNVETAPMFKEKKLIVLESIFKNKDFKDNLLDYLKKSDLLESKDAVVLISELLEPEKIRQLKKEKLFIELTKSPTVFKEYENLNSKQLEKWISDIIGKENIKIDKGALNLFVSLVPINNVFYIKKELEKLILYAKSNNNLITKEGVELLIGEANTYQNIFQFLDYLGEKKNREAISLIHKLIRGGKNEIFILAIIVGHIKNLVKVRSLIEQNKTYPEILRKLKIHPFVLKKVYGQAQKFSLRELKKIYLLLFETDLNIKTGRIEPGLAIDLLVSNI